MIMEKETHGNNIKDPRKEWLLSANTFSWSDYVTVVLVDSGHVSAASIQNIPEGKLWAGTSNFKLSVKEVQAIDEGFTDSTQLRVNGIYVNGRHFTLTRITDRKIMVGRDARTGAGCVLFRCQLCLVSAVYEENNHPGSCYNIVTQLGDFLVECGL